MIDSSKLTEILHDAISDYASHSEEKSPAEWLQGYLGEKLPEKPLKAIQVISGEILSTLDLMAQKKQSMNEALESGQSAENWFANEVTDQSGGKGSKARLAAEFLSGISSAYTSDSEPIDVEMLEETDEDWSNDHWNDYKLKKSAKEVAIEAGKAGLREIASEVFQKAAEEGISQMFSDKEFIADTLTKGSCEGLKVAVSAGLSIAEETGVIPPASFQVLAATANKTVESFIVFSDVAKGKSTITEALIKIKNTAVSTLCGMVYQYKDSIKSEIVEVVSYVFGVKGAAIAGAVYGAITPPQECSRIQNAIKEAAKAVWNVLSKEIHLPAFNKNKNKQINYNPD